MLLVCRDFNARNVSWGNPNNNPQGLALNEALLETDLTLLNCLSMTRLATKDTDSDSNIDLALMSGHGATDAR